MAISADKTPNVMAPPRHSTASSRDSHRITSGEKSKKRRQRRSDREEDESITSLPPTKKLKTGNLRHQDESFELSSPTIDPHNANLSGPNDHVEIKCHIGASLMSGLADSYQLTDMNIISSSKIHSKVTLIVEKLGSFSFVAATKPNIVLLRAKGAVSSKLITIVEIAKREIVMAGGKWYQYNVLGQITALQSSTSTSMNGGASGPGPKLNTSMDDMDLDEQEDSQIAHDEGIDFETMKTPLVRAIEAKPIVRAVPVILIFLTRVRSDALKGAYGEQTNALT